MSSIKDKIAGTAKEIEGKLTGDKVREAQGTVQKVKGKVEEVASRVVDDVKAAGRRIEDKVRGTTDDGSGTITTTTTTTTRDE